MAGSFLSDHKENRLTSFTRGSATATYAYNGDGLRVSKTASGVSTSFVWDLADGMPIIVQAGTMKYVTGPGGLPIEQIDSANTVYYYLQDQLGSTRALTDATGLVKGSFSYNPFGDVRSSSGTVTTPFGYAGQYTDSETGFVYLRARYYDPSTQQFLSVDPLQSVTGEPYAYTGGDPLNTTDPNGLITIQLCAAVSAAWGKGGFIQGCVAIGTGDRSIGVTGTVGVGGGTPSASLTGQLLVSNASSVDDLKGPFGYAGGSGGVGLVAGGEGFWGTDSRGGRVLGGGPEFGPGLDFPDPLPAEGHAGVSYTWAAALHHVGFGGPAEQWRPAGHGFPSGSGATG